ncbi:MAG: R3H domain-containing nucleic acid-binding protein [Polyangiaceae bacterium]
MGEARDKGDEAVDDGVTAEASGQREARRGEASLDGDGNNPAPRGEGAGPAVSDEPFEEDGRADTALDFVIDLLAAMGMHCRVDLLENEPEDPPEEIRLEIEGRDAARIIGKKGQTLAALQFITNRVVNRPGRKRRHVVIDAEGYRARREDTLSSMARRLGKQAVDEGKIITFEPMNPQDRRVVHLALAKFPGVVTKSDGEGEGRRVQIIPVRR